MTEPSLDIFRHGAAFVVANADTSIRKVPHRIDATPLDELVGAFADNDAVADAAHAITARRLMVTLSTRHASFDVWAALGRLEYLLSDFRRIAPRFSFEQLSGEARIAAGNDYRMTSHDPARIAAITAACRDMDPTTGDVALDGGRIMDLRVVRTGPWGGETGELVVETLKNHAVAGTGSLWVVAHDENGDGTMRIGLDAFEMSRWAWLPDMMTAGPDDPAPGVLDWPYLFERLADELDATVDTSAPNESFNGINSSQTVATDPRVKDALRMHPALTSVFEQAARIQPPRAG